ncbi:MAG: sigma-70 family RNA polymerase sigma factor [Myxococcaceae bacterium]|nr:sigma-70 family RNA polymerase sigma factor [Myxococcaceae bacterium]
MTPQEREELEREVRRLCAQGEHARAAETAIRGYGPEILGVLVATHREEETADEIFAQWSERLWRGMGGFTWSCALRTWAHTLARNASISFQRHERYRGRLHPPMPGSEALSRIAEKVRTETRPYLRTEAKSKLAALRDSLPPEDRTLLVLRIDKGLEWKDLARVMLGEEAELSEAQLTKESQRLRKRFQLLKDRLVEQGRREGLFSQE